MAGSSTDSAVPAFRFSFADALDYLVSEEQEALGREWVPVRKAPRDVDPVALELEVAQRGLQPLRMPDPFPFDDELCLRAATYAKQIGRVVAFSRAAFRQCYAAGRPLSETETILIAGAACEIHPRALLQALERGSIEQALSEASGG